MNMLERLRLRTISRLRKLGFGVGGWERIPPGPKRDRVKGDYLGGDAYLRVEGRDAMTYTEGERSLLIEFFRAPPEEGEQAILVYSDDWQRWNWPHLADVIDNEKRSEIRKRLMGWRWGPIVDRHTRPPIPPSEVGGRMTIWHRRPGLTEATVVLRQQQTGADSERTDHQSAKLGSLVLAEPNDVFMRLWYVGEDNKPETHILTVEQWRQFEAKCPGPDSLPAAPDVFIYDTEKGEVAIRLDGIIVRQMCSRYYLDHHPIPFRSYDELRARYGFGCKSYEGS